MNKIEISQKTANKLVKIYDMLDNISSRIYHQDNSDTCAIGHAIEKDVIKAFRFTDAMKEMELGEIENVYYDYGNITNDSINDVIADYLFGTTKNIISAANVLELPNDCTTPEHAQIRIKAFLDKVGYDIEEKWYYV